MALFSVEFRSRCRWLLIVVVGASLFVSAFSCRCCIVHGGGIVPPHLCLRRLWRIVVVVVVGISSLLLAMYFSLQRLSLFSWQIFSASAPRRRCWHRHLVVVVCVSLLSEASLFVFVVLSFPSSASFRCRLRNLVVVSVSLLLAADSLLMAASIRLCNSSSLLPYRHFCRRLRLVLVVGVS